MNTAIICEFNPFHQGHKYLINSVKKSGDAVICVMSGNFVQRGDFAVYNKRQRCIDAINGSADLVIELPTVYSTLSAEGFAKNAVAIIEATNVANQIAFGAECDNIEELRRLADKIKLCQNDIADIMKTGVSYPTARNMAINSPLLKTPNNILALEYLNATSLPCVAIKRIGKGHDSDDKLLSASEIRKTLSKDEISLMDRCDRAILAKIRTMSKEDFLQIDDVNEGLENRIENAAKTASSVDELIEMIKTKRYTLSRIRRIILRCYLGITKSDTLINVPYIRILGFNAKGKEILSEISKKATLPIVTKTSNVRKLSCEANHIFDIECKATALYNLGFKVPKDANEEERYQIVSM